MVTGWHDDAVILTVWVPGWVLEEDRLIVSLGDEWSSWLTFEEAAGPQLPGAEPEVVRGTARGLPSWPGASPGRHPVRIDIEAGCLYWDAPAPVEGPIEVAGSVESNNIDAPVGVPETRGVVRRITMRWHTIVLGPDRVWTYIGAPRREEVSASYLPPLPAPGVIAERPLPGATEASFSGVLLDLELTGTVDG